MIARKEQQSAVSTTCPAPLLDPMNLERIGESAANCCGPISFGTSNLQDVNLVVDDMCCSRVPYPTASGFRKPPCATTGLDRLRI